MGFFDPSQVEWKRRLEQGQPAPPTPQEVVPVETNREALHRALGTTPPTPILTYARAVIPETWDIVHDPAGGNWGNSGTIDPFQIELGRALAKLFVDGTTEDSITNEFVRAYIADYVVLNTIPALIDYYMVKTRRNDSMQRPPGVTPLGGESSINYDRVAALKDVALRIIQRMDEDYDEFVALTRDITRVDARIIGAAISSLGQALETIDPATFSEVAWSAPVITPGFGVVYTRETVPVRRTDTMLDPP